MDNCDGARAEAAEERARQFEGECYGLRRMLRQANAAAELAMQESIAMSVALARIDLRAADIIAACNDRDCGKARLLARQVMEISLSARGGRDANGAEVK